MRRILTSLLTVSLILAAAAAWAPSARAQTTAALIDSLERTGFNYFWNESNAANGLVRDRSEPTSPASIAAVGFGLSSICVGVDHGWVPRTQAASRVLTTLNTFWTGPQGSGSTGTIGYKGLFYHFLDMNTGLRTWDSELSTIDTALLLAGIIDCKQYFTTSDPNEVQIRALADSIYRRTDWVFMQNLSSGIFMGWKPGTGFGGFGKWIGYNEASIMYILALGSPTHPSSSSGWSYWTSGYQFATYYGYSYVNFPPLFGHQYSQCWLDMRTIADSYMHTKGITYFENSRRATLAQRAYCIANPGHWTGYSDSLWSLTASDDPYGYNAHGAPPAQVDNGTISPTAALSSMPFTPTESQAVMWTLWRNYNLATWGRYGFTDAFNPTVNWYGIDYLGIDVGPIVLMCENYQNQNIWTRFMLNADVQNGLARAGFLSATAIAEGTGGGTHMPDLLTIAPNPIARSAAVRYHLPRATVVRLVAYDAGGRQVATLVEGLETAGDHMTPFDVTRLAPGVYSCRLVADGVTVTRKCVVTGR